MSSASCRAALGVSGGALRGCVRLGVASGALRSAGPRPTLGPGPFARPIVVRRTAPGPCPRVPSDAFACDARNFGRDTFLLAADTAASTARRGSGASEREELVRFVVRFAGAGFCPASSDRFFVAKIDLAAPTNPGAGLGRRVLMVTQSPKCSTRPRVNGTRAVERKFTEFAPRLARSTCEP